MKFEEKVEEGGERWSKPHVSTLTLHSLFELRTCLQTGSILLDLEGYSLPQIVGEPPLALQPSGWKRPVSECWNVSWQISHPAFLSRRYCGSADCRRPHSSRAEREDQLCVVEEAPAPDQEAYPPLTGWSGKVLQCCFKYVCVSFSCFFKYQSAVISVVQPAIVMMLACSFACPYEITSVLLDHFSSAGALSDRSSQANLNRSTSSTSGVHRSTEDLRSWQSSSLGRLRESAPTNTSKISQKYQTGLSINDIIQIRW